MATMARTVSVYRLRLPTDWKFVSMVNARHLASSDGNETGGGEKKPPSWYKRIFSSPFARRKRQEDLEFEAEQEENFQAEEAMLRAMESEQKADRLLRKQNKSRLHFSDRQMLRGRPPNVGLYMEWCERHITREYKAKLLGQFGRTNTGIDPSLTWPTKREIQRQKDYEKVLYNNMTLKEMMATEKNKVAQEREAIFEREREIDKKLDTMDVELKAWQKRITSRRQTEEKDRNDREQMFSELRQEYGYDINPGDPQFADRIAQKEKELSKRNKELKKQQKLEKAAEKASAAAAASSDANNNDDKAVEAST